MELYGTLRLGEKFRNFMELFNVFYGTEQLWLPGSGAAGDRTHDFSIVSDALTTMPQSHLRRKPYSYVSACVYVNRVTVSDGSC